MLKALELHGFKSFADKTRFEFPAGITVVVGPNGSGKSNIVDAIKWVLGEQSAKSLRGKDMSDVIFKGSGGTGRTPLNTAEASIIFENEDGLLPVDAPEVHITRRVYRSGEGEYLINGNPCRLKDIRDLFRGTGVGTDAYSLIEQGKVDRLLQASPKERRAIFEEAAGISRFKAKRVEAERRLARVEQNLLRLSDIVDEVESRLRSIRSQASKARRYREYSSRLQELRTQVGRTDWRQLTEKLNTIETQLSQLSAQSEESQTLADELEAAASEVDARVNSLGEQIREAESRTAGLRETIAELESTTAYESKRMQDLEADIARRREQIALLTGRAGTLERRLAEMHGELSEAETQHQDALSRLQSHEAVIARCDEDLDQLRRDSEATRHAYVAASRSVTSLGNRSGAYETKRETLDKGVSEQQRRLQDIDKSHRSLTAELEISQQGEKELATKVGMLEERLAAITEDTAEKQRVMGRRGQELAQWQGRYSGVTERADVLEDLERKQEGISPGVKEVLTRAGQAVSGPFASVAGLVVDILHVEAKLAPLIDVALGPAAQHVVVTGTSLFDELQFGRFRPSGRVGVIAADAQDDSLPEADLSGMAGVVGRADRLVETSAQFAPLARRLLQSTWLVETLADALMLRQRFHGERIRFVTRAGDLVESDGSVAVGPRTTGVGLVSRRSELREARQEILDLENRIRGEEVEIRKLKENIDQQVVAATRLSDQLADERQRLEDRRVATRSIADRLSNLTGQKSTIETELQVAQERRDEASQQLEATRRQLADVEATLAELETALGGFDGQVAEIEARRKTHGRDVTEAKIEAAACEQRLDSIRTQVAQLEEDRRERTRGLSEAREQLAESLLRRSESQRNILAVTPRIAQAFLDKDNAAREVRELARQRQEITAQRAEDAQQLQSLRKSLRVLQEKLHKQELAAGEARHQRETLAERLLDDYGIEVAQLEQAAASVEEEQERDAIEQEIADLRRKISNIGAVNMEALDELDDLETRYNTLSGQYRDLVDAKESLQRIINKINADSRRLFTETLEGIRTNFQALYRKAFGGGTADIVLEEGVDILECGIEIVATPPGKPSFNNSLLSGGEKALTAVSLLMAIFEYRPSPFCVLDEVDAPFDEANIGRFMDVLKGFLGWTRFVIVTHSKKTMSSATTLYGVTMQESGVSKRVSVRFEDVSEDGHINADAIHRDDDQAA